MRHIKCCLVLLCLLNTAWPSWAQEPGKDLIAEIVVPSSGALVRGDVPVYGLAYGKDFMEYVLDYGFGEDPQEWFLIKRSSEQQKDVGGMNDINFDLVKTVEGNLGMWVTGLSEYPYAEYPVDLEMGTYTLRLRAWNLKKEIKTARVLVDVGRVALNCVESHITSSDGRVRLDIPEHSLLQAAKVFSLKPLKTIPENLSKRENLKLVSPLYRIQPSGERFTQDVSLTYMPPEEGQINEDITGIFLYDTTVKDWEVLKTYYDGGKGEITATLDQFPSRFSIMGVFEGDDLATSIKEEAIIPKIDQDSRFLVHNNFENGPEQWSNKHRDKGAQLDVVSENCSSGRCLRISNVPGEGSFAALAYPYAFDTAIYPNVQFDYLIPPDVKVNLLVKVSNKWYDIEFTDDPKIYWDLNMEKIGTIDNVQNDGTWRRASFDLNAMLSQVTDQSMVQEMVFADWDSPGFKKLEFGKTPAGSIYLIDNFRIQK